MDKLRKRLPDMIPKSDLDLPGPYTGRFGRRLALCVELPNGQFSYLNKTQLEALMKCLRNNVNGTENRSFELDKARLPVAYVSEANIRMPIVFVHL
jgi:hypothetical protein